MQPLSDENARNLIAAERTARLKADARRFPSERTLGRALRWGLGAVLLSAGTRLRSDMPPRRRTVGGAVA